MAKTGDKKAPNMTKKCYKPASMWSQRQPAKVFAGWNCFCGGLVFAGIGFYGLVGMMVQVNIE